MHRRKSSAPENRTDFGRRHAARPLSGSVAGRRSPHDLRRLPRAPHHTAQAAWSRKIYPQGRGGMVGGIYPMSLFDLLYFQHFCGDFDSDLGAPSTLHVLPCTGPRRPALRCGAHSEPRKARRIRSRSGAAGAACDTRQSALPRRCQRHQHLLDKTPHLAMRTTSHSQCCIHRIA